MNFIGSYLCNVMLGASHYIFIRRQNIRLVQVESLRRLSVSPNLNFVFEIAENITGKGGNADND